jgi:2-polyprenyl-6-methoxyphenol hydroxylase-like FAD-dependent oxidoreductase
MNRNAVIIGGGLAGLLAAHALLGGVERLTVIEQDRYPQQPEFGGGIPQGRHVHVLITGGQQILDELLPGVVDSLKSAGARHLMLPRDMLVYTRTGWHHRFPEGRFSLVSCTRPLLDHIVRDRVLSGAAESGTELSILQGTRVTGLLGTADRVAGVVIRQRGEGAASAQATREMTADLVVDASGRRSRAPRWLQDLGARAAREDRVDAKLAYATRLYRFAHEPDAAVNIWAMPDCPRGGVLLPVEGGRWLLTLSGFGGHGPATDEAGFLEHTARLKSAYLWDLMKNAEPLSPVFGFADTANCLRHYDEKGAAPDGFVAVGDAQCAFNPLYGQGMTVAAAHALALHKTLAKRQVGAGFAAQAQRAVARESSMPWLYTTSADRPYLAPPADGARGVQRLAQWYTDRLIDHVAVDNTVGEALRGVFGLVLPPTSVLSPSVALRTLRRPRPSLAEPPLSPIGLGVGEGAR